MRYPLSFLLDEKKSSHELQRIWQCQSNVVWSTICDKYSNYGLQTKSRKGNVFTGVCHSCHSAREEGGGGVGTSHTLRDRSHDKEIPALYFPFPLPRHPLSQTSDLGPPPATDIWWSSLETCSNSFPCGPTPTTPPHLCWHLVVPSGRYASHWNAVLSNFVDTLTSRVNFFIEKLCVLGWSIKTTFDVSLSPRRCVYLTMRHGKWSVLSSGVDNSYNTQITMA